MTIKASQVAFIAFLIFVMVYAFVLSKSNANRKRLAESHGEAFATKISSILRYCAYLLFACLLIAVSLLLVSASR